MTRPIEEFERPTLEHIADLGQCHAALQDEILAHKQAELALARLAAIVESSSDAILSKSPEGLITSWNHGAERMFGYEAAEVIGKDAALLVPLRHRSDETQIIRRIECEETVGSIETVRVAKDGRLIDVSLTLSPLRDGKGRLTGLSAIMRDVSERKRSEQALRASEAKFRGLVECAPDAIVIVDRDGLMLLVNSRTEQMFGYQREELLGRPMELLMPERYRAPQAGVEGLFCAGRHGRPAGVGLELFGKRKDGSEFPAEIRLSPLQTESGELLCTAIRDTTDRRRTEEALRESEARLQAIMDNSPMMIFVKDTMGRYLHFNRQFGKVFHLSLNPALGKTDAELFPPKQAAAFRANDLKVLEAGVPMVFDEVSTHDDGLHAGITTKFPLFDAQGKIYALGAIVTDITERKRLEMEILEISEREQRRISQDLHDGVGQVLAGISCLTNVLQRNLEEQASPEATTAARISALLDSAVAQTRSLARGLYPVSPEPTGLMSALAGLAASVTDLFKVACRLKCPHPVFIEDDTVATHLYRIAQEAVTNSLKHGKARHITIGLSATWERIVLAVSDDGVGFKEMAGQAKGLGLRIMQYRAGMIGGTLSVSKKSGAGTEVVCVAERVAAPHAKG